jgi:hypothetical protein
MLRTSVVMAGEPSAMPVAREESGIGSPAQRSKEDYALGQSARDPAEVELRDNLDADFLQIQGLREICRPALIPRCIQRLDHGHGGDDLGGSNGT